MDEVGFVARLWNLLVVINPGVVERARQQFTRGREHVAEEGLPLEGDRDWLPALFRAIAWK
ncbi:hypothetical protein AAGG49_22010, partial [Stenotrophomonas maltophilia]